MSVPFNFMMLLHDAIESISKEMGIETSSDFKTEEGGTVVNVKIQISDQPAEEEKHVV